MSNLLEKTFNIKNKKEKENIFKVESVIPKNAINYFQNNCASKTIEEIRKKTNNSYMGVTVVADFD